MSKFSNKAIAFAMAAATLQAIPANASVQVLSQVPDAGLGHSYVVATVAPQSADQTDPRAANDIVQDRMATAIDTSLAKKGYHRAGQDERPDFVVAYTLGVQDKTGVGSNPGVGAPMFCGAFSCWGGVWGGWGPAAWGFSNWGFNDTYSYNYTQGTARVSLLDASTGRALWIGSNTKSVNAHSADQNQLQKVADQIFKKLPAAN